MEKGEVVEELGAAGGEEVKAVAEEAPHPELLLGALLLQQAHIRLVVGTGALLQLLQQLLLGARGHGLQQSLHDPRRPLSRTSASTTSTSTSTARGPTAQGGEPGAGRGYHRTEGGHSAAPPQLPSVFGRWRRRRSWPQLAMVLHPLFCYFILFCLFVFVFVSYLLLLLLNFCVLFAKAWHWRSIGISPASQPGGEAVLGLGGRCAKGAVASHAAVVGGWVETRSAHQEHKLAAMTSQGSTWWRASLSAARGVARYPAANRAAPARISRSRAGRLLRNSLRKASSRARSHCA